MNGPISADIPASHRPPARKPADEAAAAASAETGTPPPGFAELLGATQARFGTRIGAMVQSIVPDGRGLSETKPSATEQRLGEQGQDAEQAQLRKREALRDAENDEPIRPRQREDRREGKGETIRDDAKLQADSGRTASGRSTGNESLPPPRSDDSPSAESSWLGAAAKAVQSRPVDQAASLTPSAVSSSGTPSAPVQEAAAPESVAAVAPVGPSDGGLLAEQIGDLLGARPTPEGGSRAGSVSAVEPVGPAETARKESSGSSRPMVVPKPPPGRSQTAHETTPGKRGSFDRLVRSIRTQVGPRVSTARLQLTPPELGRVRIDVRVVQQRMELSIQAQTPQARDVLASRLTELRSALADQGLTLDRCEISLPPTEDALSGSSPREDFERRGSRHVEAAVAARPRAGVESPEGEETDSASAEAMEWEGNRAASEMRLDIRV